jgi:hypothetical protein
MLGCHPPHIDVETFLYVMIAVEASQHLHPVSIGALAFTLSLPIFNGIARVKSVRSHFFEALLTLQDLSLPPWLLCDGSMFAIRQQSFNINTICTPRLEL